MILPLYNSLAPLTLMRRVVAAAAEDPDAAAYLDAVEVEDGQALEAGVRAAVNDFVVGCKSDGIWSAIKASCILAGARTLDGALVPLVGSAPTNNNFVSGDYDREDGLLGNGSTKYLDSNRNNNADPQNDKHLAVYLTSTTAGNKAPIGSGGGTNGSSQIIQTTSGSFYRINFTNTITTVAENLPTGFVGATRSNASTIDYRRSGTTTNYGQTSATPLNANIDIFRRSGGTLYSNQRIAFYSIGESIDLADLDSRVSTLMTDLAAAIP